MAGSLPRKTPLRSNPEKTRAWQQRSRKPLPKLGKKGKDWEKAKRTELKPAFTRAGITTCELRYEGCWRDNTLGYGHSLKRRKITTHAELLEVVLACNHCHDILEAKPAAEMAQIVRQIRADLPIFV